MTQFDIFLFLIRVFIIINLLVHIYWKFRSLPNENSNEAPVQIACKFQT